MTQRWWSLSTLTLPAFFALKVLSALLLLKMSSALLDVAGFAVFSQFLLLSALVNMIAVGGSQNGIIRAVAVAREGAAVARVRDGAVLLWLLAIGVVGLPLTAGSPLVADLLSASPQLWWVVLAIVALNFVAGPGQIGCAVLTGSGRPAASLVAQGAGLGVGTAAAAAMLLAARPLEAAIGFAAGPLATLHVARWFLRRKRLPPIRLRGAWPESRALIQASAAFLALAILTPASLFAMRGLYQDVFGLEPLGYWLTANRISDTTTQFLALFLLQYFMPAYAASVPGSAKGRRAILASWGVSLAVMACFPLVFALAPRTFVRVFLSSDFFPAIPGIIAYMIGDVLRVWSALAMQAAFARGRLLLFVGIELATILLMGLMLAWLISLGNRGAPFIAYPAAYGLMAAAITLYFLAQHVRRQAPAAPPS